MATPEEPRSKRPSPREPATIGLIGLIAIIAIALVAAASMVGLERPRGDGASCSAPTTSIIGDAPDLGCSYAPDRVQGDLILLNDNGGWSWYQDERAIVDAVGRTLVFSSVANRLGHEGERRDANVEVTTFELSTGRRTRVALANVPTFGVGDDHNAAALWQRPDGRYLAMYTGHLEQRDGAPVSFYRITTSPHDGSDWGAEQPFTWPTNDAIEPIRHDVTYSNLLYASREASEGRLYNIGRAADRAPNIMVSDDWGETWRYAGKLATTDAEGQQEQYSNGYFKFASNGVDRFDFIATEHHPRDFDTSIYHGYVRGGRSYTGCGALRDRDLWDEVAPEPAQFTPVWLASEVSATSHHHGWTVDLERGDDGALYALFTTRRGTSVASALPGDCDHRLFYGRFDGSRWHTTEVARMGPPLYFREQDYTGLGAIHPNDPSTIYISTPVDPRRGSKTDHHEIYEGVTPDGGITWRWTPITMGSTVDNLRPIIPSWDAHHTAVLWLRGRYLSMRSYDLAVVGIIEGPRDEPRRRITYVDANERNTTLADGSPLSFTAGTSAGAADDQWHERHGFGNSGSVLTSNEQADEDAPRLTTTVDGLEPGTYDVFVLHWAPPDEDWRIQAGLSPSQVLVLRRSASQLVVASDVEDGVESISLRAATRMYRAHVGRVDVDEGGTIEVLVDDAGGGELQRTWYDGVGYARVSS